MRHPRNWTELVQKGGVGVRSREVLAGQSKTIFYSTRNLLGSFCTTHRRSRALE